MNKTVRKILQAISYLITLFLGAAGGRMVVLTSSWTSMRTIRA
jgi:hypothetical protein